MEFNFRDVNFELIPGGMGDQTVEYMHLEFKEGVGDAINLRILSK